MNNDCIFCQIVRGDSPATIVCSATTSLGIVPLNPVVEGHVIFISRKHVASAVEWASVTGDVVEDAATYAKDIGSCNIITSVGTAATQSVRHLHVHIVPRRRDDGLLLPWGSNEAHMKQNDKMAYEFYNGGGPKVTGPE